MSPKNISLASTLEEIVRRIRDCNLTNSDDPLPYSDSVYKLMMSDIIESADRLNYHLRVLSDAHYIFGLKITEDDEAHNMKGLTGYVVAEESVINVALDKSSKKLERLYEVEFRKLRSASAIIHELFPQMSKYKNTPIGQALNSTVMLQQYISVIKESAEEYTESFKEKRLNEILPELSRNTTNLLISEDDFDEEDNLESNGGIAGTTEADTRRAIDMPEYLEIEKMDLSGKWGEAVSKYSVQFLLRIHMRKHEFHNIKILIKQHRVAREADLRFLRDSLKKIEDRMDLTSPEYRYRNEITDLRRLTQSKLNQIFIARKEYTD